MEPSKAEKMATTIRLDERLRERRTETETLPPAPSPIGPGSMVGPYLLGELIGEGGMGLVYKATDTILERTVALKILPPYLTRNPDLLHRIRTEAHAQARLHHPNIVTLYSVLEVPAGFVLVMEYVEGATLRQHIHSHGPLAPAEAVRVFDQAMRGIGYAHEKGIVHRDLKPDNIFLTRKGEVKIMDFGVAKIIDSREPTRTRSLVGTLLYIAPEQINGRDADFRSDIYTLGIGLFEAVTGRLPFERQSDYALMHAHVLEKPPRPRGIRGNLPRELEGVILKAIEKEPERRYQTMDSFRTALLMQSDRYGLLNNLPVDEHGPGSWAVRIGNGFRRRQSVFGGMAIDIALVAMAVILILALGFYPGRQPPPDDVDPVMRLSPSKRAFSGNSTKAGKPAPGKGAIRSRPEPARRDEPSHREKESGSTDKRYDTLRKAWGG